MKWTPGMRRMRRRIGGVLLPMFGLRLVRILARSWTFEVLDPEHLVEGRTDDEPSGGRLIALWHGRMLVGLVPHRDRAWTVLVSTSDDGDLTKTLLEHYGYRVVRGSSSRRGSEALRELVARLRTGDTVVITPDGPRGPRHSTNHGLAWMARETGLPVVPGGFVCDRARHLKSWDRFTIPRRHARLVIAYGPPVRVEADADDAGLERATQRIQERMLAAEERAFAHLGVERDW